MSRTNFQWSLVIAATGVVYGDIGTSPLYALKECFSPTSGLAVSQANVLGILSLIFWSLTIVICIKYLSFVMLAQNKGEGGIFALAALLLKGKRGFWNHPTQSASLSKKLILSGAVFGAALLYGDGVITPAISVLSAVEGLSVATPTFNPVIVPLTIGILLGLFMIQKRGTGSLGKYFGPIMLLWFLTIGLIGIWRLTQNFDVLTAINPLYAVNFFRANGFVGFIVLGAAVLCITGDESLYTDMGHFGRRHIQIAWYSLVYPSLILNYFGQGALILKQPELITNPFYGAVPPWFLYPMVLLATIATVIASQAVISGAYSLTHQAILLGYCPRLRTIHTSAKTHGQIYMPQVNTFLMVACLTLVLAFRESGALAEAYGLAVTGSMTITSIMFFLVITQKWHWPLYKAMPIVGLFLMFDITYLVANIFKIPEGGWITLLIATSIALAMTTWKKGRAELARRFTSTAQPVIDFINQVRENPPHRVKGTAVFMTVTPEGIPHTLMHHFKHNQVLHEQIILLTIRGANSPHIHDEEKIEIENLGEGFYRVIAQYGFMDTPNIPEILTELNNFNLNCPMETTTFYLGRETLLASGPARIGRWRKELFAFLSKNAWQPTSYFGIPATRAIELGAIIEL